MTMQLLFVLVVAALLMLPLVPALRELFRASDNKALSVVQSHDGRPENFSINFRQFAHRTMEASTEMETVADAEKPIVTDTPALELRQDPGETLLASGSVNLCEDLWMHEEVYAKQTIVCAPRVHARALLAEESLRTASDVTILRWAHSKEVSIGDRNELYGRLTASDKIEFRNRAVFQRLNAPRIDFHSSRRQDDRMERPNLAQLQRITAPEIVSQVLVNKAPHRSVALTSFTLPEFSIFEGDLIVRGKLKIGEGCWVKGSIKADGNILIGARVRVSGTIVTRESLFIGHDTHIAGLVVGERKVRIGRNVQIGDSTRPTTITAEEIVLAPGTQVYGTIWARRLGRAQGA
jgi:cytoskeletal protein CcmA (bactofilin family)